MEERIRKAAAGEIPAELVFKHANVLNVFTEQFEVCDVAVEEGQIVGIGEYSGREEIDLEGKYLVPGWIDSHLHLESTLVQPCQLIEQAERWGTTTFIVDPHEAANVAGAAGIRFLMDATASCPANVYIMAPSCVPSSPLDESGAELKAEDLAPFLEEPRILGLGEVMDCPSVLSGEKEMTDKLRLFEGRPVDGHAPGLSGKALCGYVAAGIQTDHECVSWEEALEKCRRGMYILIRQGSAAKNLEAIVSGLVREKIPPDRFCFCTDDRHIEEIIRDGHISCHIRESVRMGISPVKALKMASYHAAECYGLHHLGAIAPGRQADLVVLPNLVDFRPDMVYHKGKPVEGKECPDFQIPEPLLHTVRCLKVTAEQFQLDTSRSRTVLQMIPGQILTGSRLSRPEEQGLLRIAVLERHRGSGHIGLGLAEGYGICHGAAASSVSHDSHNIIVIGDNEDDMALAVNRLIELQGGYVLAGSGKIQGELPLPVMGLMSGWSYEKVEQQLAGLVAKAHAMGVPEGMDPFITLSFIALPVIPQVRLTTSGMYDVQAGRLLE